MDAVEFLKELKRRCESDDKCRGLKLPIEYVDPTVLVAQVEQWSKDHPAKTRQSEFMKRFPYVITDPQGAIDICPLRVNRQESCRKFDVTCSECRRDYWSQEVK